MLPRMPPSVPSRACVRRAPLLLLLANGLAHAGPPLLTNDPDTPGPGAWEINLAATGDRHDGGWDVDAPDVDLNRGVGERIQLSLHVPWSHAHADGGRWQSGWGAVEFGVRWRFLDQGEDGWKIAVQPQWVSAFSHAAQRQGLAPAHDEWVLPVQASHPLGRVDVVMEVARHVVAHEADTWQAGVFADAACRARLHCLVELNTTWDGGARTAFNLGAVKAVNPHLNLLGSAGTELTGPAQERAHLLFYLGAQLLL
jgi:hypothetical protein